MGGSLVVTAMSGFGCEMIRKRAVMPAPMVLKAEMVWIIRTIFRKRTSILLRRLYVDAVPNGRRNREKYGSSVVEIAGGDEVMLLHLKLQRVDT